jgi:hypothetical protein
MKITIKREIEIGDGYSDKYTGKLKNFHFFL